MMAFQWNETQKLAIETPTQNILVSAAAGSGKTAVLTARIIRLIKSGVSLDKLVVLTFTNKAAKEMKSRIRERLLEQSGVFIDLDLLDSAHIETFDAYALHIVKKYGHHLNISKQATVMEKTEAQIEKKRTIEAVFTQYYDKPTPAFLDYLNAYANKDDHSLQAQILYFYNQLALRPKLAKDKHQYIDRFFTDQHFETLFNSYEAMLCSQAKAIYHAFEALVENGFSDPVIQRVANETLEALSFLIEATDYDTLQQKLTNFKMPRLQAKGDEDPIDEDEKEAFTQQRKQINDKRFTTLKKNVAYDKKTHYQRFMASKKHLPIIVDILEAFEKMYLTRQKEKERFDFPSIAAMALELVENFPEINRHIKANTHEILIDEYQDTNPMQEAFITAISDDNLYMVGDIKQSIYRFRDADVSIFSEKYRRYKENNEGLVIDLNQNYRSRKQVLDDINAVFTPLMDETIGGVLYDRDQKLYFGNQTLDVAVDHPFPYGGLIHTYDSELIKDAFPKPFTAKTLEAFKATHLIKELMTSHPGIKAGDASRELRYGDIAILIDRSTDFKMFKDVFDTENIPLILHKEAPFLDHNDVMALKSLLILIDTLHTNTIDETFIHAFLSVTRSFIFQYQDADIFAFVQKIQKTTKACTKTKLIHDQTFGSFFQKLYDLVENVKCLALHELLESAIDVFEVEANMVHLKQTNAALKRLDTLRQVAKNQSQDGLDLKAFLAYFDEVITLDEDIETAQPMSFHQNAVHLMTMHKAKGLQFPVVILPHLDNAFRFTEARAYAFHKSYGFLLKGDMEDGLVKSFLFDLEKQSEKIEIISERLRLFYVALTRAIDQVHLIMPKPTTSRPRPLTDFTKTTFSSFYDMIIGIADRLSWHRQSFDAAAYKDKINYHKQQSRQKMPSEKKHSKTYQAPKFETTEKLSHSYAHGVKTFLSLEEIKVMAYGDLLHNVLEHLDFYAPIAPQLDQMALDEEEKAVIQTFFTQPFMQDKALQGVYKEHPFLYADDDSDVRGFIDLLIETKSTFMVIDYKLKNIDKPEYITQVEGYVNTLRMLSDKPVEGYLYSILDGTYKKVV